MGDQLYNFIVQFNQVMNKMAWQIIQLIQSKTREKVQYGSRKNRKSTSSRLRINFSNGIPGFICKLKIPEKSGIFILDFSMGVRFVLNFQVKKQTKRD